MKEIKENDWCWFYDSGMRTPQLHKFQCYSQNAQVAPGRRYVEEGQEPDSWGYDYMEPFVGKIPSWLKD